ncbi:hypothetical protein HZA73_05835 [candidate division TA06 bacterium]|nr:hypothetical protein [candidate division TA06 bacterium]
MCRNLLFAILAVLFMTADNKAQTGGNDTTAAIKKALKTEASQSLIYKCDNVSVKVEVNESTKDYVKLKITYRNDKSHDIGLLPYVEKEKPGLRLEEDTRWGPYVSWLEFGLWENDLLPRIIKLRKCKTLTKYYIVQRKDIPHKGDLSKCIGVLFSYLDDLKGYDYLINSERDVVIPANPNDMINFLYKLKTYNLGFIDISY